jgi:LPS O-antigen subunit length determinant protein (WzzB/FepE family)
MVTNGTSQQNISDDDEIDLRELFTVIWAHTIFIIVFKKN